MALGILMIVFIVWIIVSIIIQILLYKKESKNSVFMINMLFSMLLSYITFTSLPMNYTEQKVIAIAWGGLSLLALALKLKEGNFIIVSKVMLTIAIVGSLVQLFL